MRNVILWPWCDLWPCLCQNVFYCHTCHIFLLSQSNCCNWPLYILLIHGLSPVPCFNLMFSHIFSLSCILNFLHLYITNTDLGDSYLQSFCITLFLGCEHFNVIFLKIIPAIRRINGNFLSNLSHVMYKIWRKINFDHTFLIIFLFLTISFEKEHFFP